MYCSVLRELENTSGLRRTVLFFSPLEQIFGGKFGNLTAEIKLARSFRLYTELAGHTPTGQNDKLCLQFL